MNLHFPWFQPKSPVEPPVPPPAPALPQKAMRGKRGADPLAQVRQAIQEAIRSQPDAISELSSLEQVFAVAYRDLRPRAPMPPIRARFYPFTGVNNTIRLREGVLHVRLSDALSGAPVSVLEAIAHVLLAKLYRKPVEARHAARFRQYVGSEKVSRHAERMRQERGFKRLTGSRGRTWDLEEVFDALNARFFDGLMAKPVLTWSEHHARRLLGHYDAAHNTIVVSRVFDRPGTPRYAIEYLLYHEMLHLRHPVKMRGSMRCVHPPAFQAEERKFPEFERAKAYLKTL